MTYNSSTGDIQSDFGHLFSRGIQTMTGIQSVKSFDWTKCGSTDFNRINHRSDVILAKNGRWETLDKTERVDSVCVYNILPDCPQCSSEAFCRFTDMTRQQTECVCPVGYEGKFCKIKMCPCQNQGLCRLNEKSRKLECVCRSPFIGTNCETGKPKSLKIQH